MGEELTGLRKAAILLVQMGEESSAKVLSQFRDTEVEEVTAEIVRLRAVEPAVAEEVLTEFHGMMSAQRYVSEGGLDFAESILQSSVGATRASEIMARLAAKFADTPFRFLNRADPNQVRSFLQDEHPQTIALVLAHTTADQATAILSGLPSELQADVAHRIALMDRASPEIIQQVEDSLKRKLSSVLQPGELSTVGGVQALVDIINRADRTTERLILEALEARNKELADEVRSRMFMFEDIVTLDDRAVQLVLREVETTDLATALKGVRDDVRSKVLSNLSERAAENLGEEIEMLGPVRLRSVEESQAKIVSALRALEESGQIVIRRGNDDEFVS
ncbi:MAG: flagellar motor switch protein FliG [Pseudonocardiales bacterium]|nr:MAG: flagellar motor switch protein FliG [Pseudonocardiales bacterium]